MEVYRQNKIAVRGGWMMVNEARVRAGLAPDPGQDATCGGCKERHRR